MKKLFSIYFLLTTAIGFALAASDKLATTSTVVSIPNKVLMKIHNHICTNSWVKLYYDVLPRVIQQQKYKTMVEVGVAMGGNAESILQNTNIDMYYGVDPYLYNYDPNDSFSADVAAYSSAEGQKNFDYLYQWVKNYRLAPYQQRSQLIREKSVNASLLFDDDSLDCIFIDGDHRYEAVLQDLAAWYPKLKPGCMMLGDDYWMDNVARAVDEFSISQDKDVFFFVSDAGYRIWAIYK